MVILTRSYTAPGTSVGALTHIRYNQTTIPGALISAPVRGPQVALSRLIFSESMGTRGQKRSQIRGQRSADEVEKQDDQTRVPESKPKGDWAECPSRESE